MKTIPIALASIDQVKNFVNDIIAFPYDMDVISQRYVVDAKSIMGLFSLDLSKPLSLAVHVKDDANLSDLMEALEPYLTDDPDAD